MNPTPCNKEKLPENLKESIIVPAYTKCDKKIYSNHRDISLRQAHTTFLNFLHSSLIQYAEEIIGDYQCGFRCNGSTTDLIFYIRQIPQKEWE